MEIKDLQPRQGNVEVVVEIVDKGQIREFQKFGKAGKVCTALAKDASGQINLSLWNEQIDTIGIGDKVRIINGYVSEWQGEKQLTTGRLGKLEVIEKGEKQDRVYTNIPPKGNEGYKDESSEGDSFEEEGLDLPEKPVDEEEYIG